MDVSRPYGVVSHPLDSAALYVLAGTTQGLTGRKIARLAPEGSQQGIAKALNRLTESGLVEQELAGSSVLYRLNRRHLAAPAVELLVNLRGELITRLVKAFAHWEIPPRHASLFGSAARGDGNSASDIDLFVVRPDGVDAEDSIWRGQLDKLAEDVRAWTGNYASIAEVADSDLTELRSRRPAIVEALEIDARTLNGPDIATLIGGLR